MKPVTFYMISAACFMSGLALATGIASVMINGTYAEIVHLNQIHRLEKEELQIKLRAYQMALRAVGQECEE